MRQFKPGQLQTGSIYPISASYAMTASYATNGGGGTVNTSSLVTTASFYTYTASQALISQSFDSRINSLTSSVNALTSSYNSFTSSYTTGSFTGSFRGDGSQLTGIVSSKWTGSNPISRNSNVEITGSLVVSDGFIVYRDTTNNFHTSLSSEEVSAVDINNNHYATLDVYGRLRLKTNISESTLQNNNVSNPNVILEFPNKTSGNYTISTIDDLTAYTTTSSFNTFTSSYSADSASFSLTKQNIPIVVSSSITAENNKIYYVIANTNFTDPTGIEGVGYNVYMVSGSVTFGGTTFTEQGTIIYRVYISGSWFSSRYLNRTQYLNLFVPQTRTINGLDLTTNRTLTADLVGAVSTASFNTFTSSIQGQVNSLTAATSSYILTSTTSSMLAPYVLTSSTSSMTVLSASFANTASFVTASNVIGIVSSASFSQTASFITASNVVGTVTSASYALSASFSENGGNQNLQQVTNNGNVTINPIIVRNILNSALEVTLKTDGTIDLRNGSKTSTLANTNVTANGVKLEFPNKTAGSYTISTTDDLNSYTATSSFNVFTSSIQGQVNSLTAATSSYMLTSATASMLAPYVLTSQTSSMTVLSASFAQTASFITASNVIGTITSASNALTASYVAGLRGIGQYIPVWNATYPTQSGVLTNSSLFQDTNGNILIGTAGSVGSKLNVLQNSAGTQGVQISTTLSSSNVTSLNISNFGPGNFLQFDSGSSVLKLTTAGMLTLTGSISATSGFTGSLQGTSSWANNAVTASFITASNVVGTVTSASYALSSSYALSASFASTASFITASSVIGTVTSSSYALSSSFATTASYATYAATASFASSTTDVLIYVKNTTGAQINKGVVVRISGATGDNALISTASYETDGVSANTLGITRENIANDSFGYVITEGTLLGISLDPLLGYTAGQLLFLGANGAITGSAPIAPLHAVRLGQVLRAQQNAGSMYVRIDNGYELDELHNVLDTSTTSSYGDLLIKSGSVWTNSKQLTGSYGLTGSLNATSFTGSLFGTASWSNNAQTASFVTASNVIGTVTSASYAVSASYLIGGITIDTGSLVSTSSFNTFTSSIQSQVNSLTSATASYVLISQTSSMLAPYVLTSSTSSMTVLSASFATSSSRAATSSLALTASFITASNVIGTVTSSSYALTASYVANASSFPYTGSAAITGSLTVTGSVNATSYIGDGSSLTLSSLATGSIISFSSSFIYNSSTSPGIGNITDNLTGSKIGIIQKIYHNSGSIPTFPAGWVKLGTGVYIISTLNIIYAEWVSGSRVEYWITQ